MGLDCSTTRKPILNSVPFHILKDIKKRYPSASALMKSELSPVINTPMLKIKDKIYLKLESHQTSGSFKIRGAFLYFQAINNQQIVVASTGNFAKACYYAYRSTFQPPFQSEIIEQNDQQQQFKKPQNGYDQYVTPTPGGEDEDQQEMQQIVKTEQKEFEQSSLVIFVPENVNKQKIAEIQCPIIYFGNDCVKCEEKARQYAAEHQSYYASPYNDINMLLGSCTIGEELEQYFNSLGEELDYVFVSCGGGGLIGGIALYLKYLKQKSTRIIGVQPKVNAAMYNILKQKPDQPLLDTISDGTSGGVEEDAITIEICRELVDDWILVKEEHIKQAQQKLLKEQKLIVEGAAALAYAGFLQYPIGHCTCTIILCGSNVDLQKVVAV